MLNRQYGIAASSSIVKVVHPEDSQPNERIQGRNRNLPPKLNTVRPPRFDRIASNSSRPPTQLARRGTWRLPSRSRQDPSSRPSGPRLNDRRNAHIAPEASTSRPTSSTAAHPAAQPTSSSTWGVAHYRSISPKLPPEPIRRRTPLDAPNPHSPVDRQPPHRPSSPLPLPGRKRKAKESPPSALPPAQKLKIEHSESSSVIKHEPTSPDSIATSRKLVRGACNFWPIPDNCRKSISNYSENRREFARAKSKELARFGLKRMRAFFREDGLVIEWTSEVPVWNDTLLPEKPQPQSKNSSTDGPSANTSIETLKRRRSIIEIADSDEDTLPSKKSRPSDPAIGSVRGPEQNTPSPKKEKVPGKHWSEGLSKEVIRKLGRGVEAASLKSHPPPLPLAPGVKRASTSTAAPVTPVSSPSKRLALPTRLTPSERKVISATFSAAASSSPERDKRPTSAIDTAANSTHSSALFATANWNSSQVTYSKPLDVDDFLSSQSLVEFLESINNADPPADEGVGADVDSSALNVGPPLPEGREEHLDSTLNNHETGAQTPRTIDPEVTSKADDLKHDEAAPPEAQILESTNEAGDVKEHVETSAPAPLPEEQRTLNNDEAGDRTMDPQVINKPGDMRHEAALPEAESQEVLESTDMPAGDVNVDTAPLPEEQRLDGTLTNDEAGAQSSRTMDPQVRKPDDMRHDEAALSEVESQEIERLCTEDHFVDLPEYEMAEDFLRRFITLFDTERSELEMAYSNDAFLSCRVPSTQPESSGVRSYASTSTLHIGRTEIVDKLNGLIGYHFSPVGEPNDDDTINYDIAVLSREVINSGPDSIEDKEAVVGGILATLHSHIVRSSSTGLEDQTMTLHQTFVLRRRTELDDSDGLDLSTNIWPLAVISHHMILREEPLLRPDQLDKLFPSPLQINVN